MRWRKIICGGDSGGGGEVIFCSGLFGGLAKFGIRTRASPRVIRHAAQQNKRLQIGYKNNFDTDTYKMKQIKAFCFFIFLALIFEANAQINQIDNLKQQFAVEKEDSKRIDLAYQISKGYSKSNPDSMVFYSKETIRLLRHLLVTEKEDTSKIGILFGISEMNQYVNNDSMVYYAQQAVLLMMRSKNNSSLMEAGVLSGLANALWWAGNYPDAKEAYFRALKIAEQLKDTMLIGRIYNGIAIVNRNASEYRQAINYFTKAEKLTGHIPNNSVLFSALIDKGKAYEQLGVLDTAYYYVQEALSMQYAMFHDKNTAGGIHSAMGIIYSKMGKEQLANEFFRQSIQLNSQSGEIRLLARGYCEFAEHLDRFNHRDSAIFYCTEGLMLDKRFNLLVQQMQASTLLAKLYKDENNIDSAYKYQQIMIETRDSIFGNEKRNRLQSLEFNEQLRQQEIEAAKVKLQEERKQNIQYALIAIGLITGILIFMALSRSLIKDTRLISFFGILALLIVFEFLNLLLHPFLERITHHSPSLMLLALVCIGALLVPLHHRLEKWATARLIERNKAIRLANAKKTIEELESKNEITTENSTNT